MQDLKTNRIPFVNLPEKKGQHQHAVTAEVMAQAVWLKPEQPAEIEFVERNATWPAQARVIQTFAAEIG